MAIYDALVFFFVAEGLALGPLLPPTFGPDGVRRIDATELLGPSNTVPFRPPAAMRPLLRLDVFFVTDRLRHPLPSGGWAWWTT